MNYEAIVKDTEKDAANLGRIITDWKTLPEPLREVFWHEFFLALNRSFWALEELKRLGNTELADRLDAARDEIYQTLDYYGFRIEGGPNWFIGEYPDRFFE